jgi:hypothetical protein
VILGWLIDPRCFGQRGWLGWVVDESFRGAAVGGGQDVGADFTDLLSMSVVDVVVGVVADPGVVVLGVVLMRVIVSRTSS